ncbi:hypothetical protein [Streptomyces sp. GbtcB6]|uniref:hypothetical protein n=1 Tax=Streptomyces sp. GbtcB6 TaxID=2824751 RepID=UPI001C30B7D2|nr:hypothetical protein [Streptomyces sp. GbtcB6]
MDLSGVAAILALLGIPASVLIARWQMRSTLRQAEEASRAALVIAESNYRNALEVAEANHRNALEVVREQADVERERWLLEARSTQYRLFQGAVARCRRSYLAQEIDREEWGDALHELHEALYAIGQVGPEEVYGIAIRLKGMCGTMADMRLSLDPDSPDSRARYWEDAVRPYRVELNQAISRALNSSELRGNRDL